MDRKNEKKLDSLLGEFLRANNLLQGYSEYKLLKNWEPVLGKQVAKATKDLYIKDRKLFVKLHSSVVRNELVLMKEQIIRRLNEAAGSDVIQDMIIR